VSWRRPVTRRVPPGRPDGNPQGAQRPEGRQQTTVTGTEAKRRKRPPDHPPASHREGPRAAQRAISRATAGVGQDGAVTDAQRFYDGVEGPFADPYFDQWDSLELAFDQLGHTTQTFQGVRAWLIALRDGMGDRTAPTTRDRYRKILTAVQRLCGPPCYVRTKTQAEIDAEVAHVDAVLAQLDDANDELVADGTKWWRCKLEGVPHHLGNKASTISARFKRIGLGSPDDRVIIFPEWGPDVGDFEPQRRPVRGSMIYR